MSRYLFIKCFEKAIIMQKTWSDTLLTALPINVALKKITNGTWKWPHKMPATSNRGLGICLG